MTEKETISYRILTETSSLVLEESVRDHLAKGWTLYGPLSVVFAGINFCCSQVMILTASPVESPTAVELLTELKLLREREKRIGKDLEGLQDFLHKYDLGRTGKNVILEALELLEKWRPK